MNRNRLNPLRPLPQHLKVISGYGWSISIAGPKSVCRCIESLRFMIYRVKTIVDTTHKPNHAPRKTADGDPSETLPNPRTLAKENTHILWRDHSEHKRRGTLQGVDGLLLHSVRGFDLLGGGPLLLLQHHHEEANQREGTDDHANSDANNGPDAQAVIRVFLRRWARWRR